jgi:hypothetical protein
MGYMAVSVMVFAPAEDLSKNVFIVLATYLLIELRICPCLMQLFLMHSIWTEKIYPRKGNTSSVYEINILFCRYLNQFYIFQTQESPAYHPRETYFPDWDGYFNLTMTYRTDSDIFMPYGQVSERKSGSKQKPLKWKSKTKLAG